MLRISEVYLSTQGEGPYVGSPTVFVRFAGCNLRCPGWPCDTPHAIYPGEYRSEWRTVTVDELVGEVHSASQGLPSYRVCLTGGEPFIQNVLQLEEFVDLLRKMVEVSGIDCFTNGTLAYPNWATEKLHIVMDWKLPGSGEVVFDKNRIYNAERLYPNSAVKFTIASREDFEAAVQIYRKGNLTWPWGVKVYAGVVWGKVENKQLIDWMYQERLPWLLNVQLHNYIWPREQRGI